MKKLAKSNVARRTSIGDIDLLSDSLFGGLELRSLRTPSIKGKKQKVGRNDDCPCGKLNSEAKKPIKFKKCCGRNY